MQFPLKFFLPQFLFPFISINHPVSPSSREGQTQSRDARGGKHSKYFLNIIFPSTPLDCSNLSSNWMHRPRAGKCNRFEFNFLALNFKFYGTLRLRKCPRSPGAAPAQAGALQVGEGISCYLLSGNLDKLKLFLSCKLFSMCS